MSRTLRVFQVDAFTNRQFRQPRRVVLDADTLSDAEMLAIARELNNGDTAFLLRPDSADHDLRVLFTPRTEAAFVGHDTIAAHAVLATLGMPPATRQRQRSGLIRVTRQPPWFNIEQLPAPLQRTLDSAELASVLAALGIGDEALDARCPPTIAGAGSTRLLLGLRAGITLATLQPDQAQLARLSPLLGAAGFFVFSLQPAIPDCGTEARMFCPALGIPEDPVSGNAHGMLGVYLLKHGLLSVTDDQASFIGAQGHHMGRPGTVRIGLQLSSAGLQRVTIAGQAVVVFETAIAL
jgi:PhzF family phenazine biosynthesis protein